MLAIQIRMEVFLNPFDLISLTIEYRKPLLKTPRDFSISIPSQMKSLDQVCEDETC